MKNKAFVTGGTGFIGTNLIKKLISRDWEVAALYRDEATRKPLRNLPVHWIKGSVTDESSLRDKIPPNTGVVFHLAGDTNLWAKQNRPQTAVNIAGTENVMTTAVQNDIPVFIHTSSVAAWGNISGTVTEQRPQHGGDSWINYERTKWAGERRALEGQEHGMKVVILNPANVIGPHDKNNWGRLFFALRDDKLPFIADGSVSIAHVDCVVEAHLAAAQKGKSGERYILGGEHHQFSDFVACINTVSGAGNMPKIIPTLLFRAYARLSAGIATLTHNEPSVTPELARLMTRNNVIYSSKKAMKQLNYTIPSMQKSVRDCYLWLKDNKVL